MSQVGKKSINAQVNQLVAKAKQTSVLVSATDLLDKSGSIDVPADVLEQVLNKVVAKCPDASIMLVTAGEKSCRLIAHSPTFQASEWIAACDPTFADGHIGAWHPTDGEESLSAFKQRDHLIQLAFGYLRENDHMPDDESSEECYFDINA